MRTDPPGERLQHRLAGPAAPASVAETAEPGAHDGGRGSDGPEDAPDAGHDGAANALLPRWLPEAVAPREGWLAAVRADPGRAGAIALGGVAVLAVLVTVFTLVRDDPAPVVSAKLPAVDMVASSTPGPPAGDAPLVVSVVGLVQTPGLVTLTPGARVADAVSAAGGTLDGADTVGLNLARHLADGEQVVVGVSTAPGAPALMGSSVTGATSAARPAPASGAETAPAGAPVNLNTATVEELDALPGVGPVTAQSIVAWRDEHGSFESVDQLGDVDGIGPARLAKLRDRVRV